MGKIVRFFRWFYAICFFIVGITILLQNFSTNPPTVISVSLVCFILGYFLMPKKKKVVNEEPSAPKRKITVNRILVILLIMCLCFIGSLFVADTDENPEKHISNTTNSARIATKYIDDISVEEGEIIDTVLNMCGISSVKTFENDSLLDNIHSEGETGYRLATSDSVKNIILYLNADKTVYSISYNTHTLYTDGAVVATIQDYTFTLDELTRIQIMCEDKVKSILKSPSTAKFPNILSWAFGKEENIVTVQSYVDAQNGFGAEIRSSFQFVIDTNTNIIQSFIFDGQELIGN